MTITEKILARASSKPTVVPGDVIFTRIDKVMMHDVSGPGVIKVFNEWEKKGKTLERIWDPNRVWVTEDHFVPAADIVSAQNIIALSNWTKKFGIKKHFKYGMGQYGICHTLSHEEALYSPVRSMSAVTLTLILPVHWEHLLLDLVIQISLIFL